MALHRKDNALRPSGSLWPLPWPVLTVGALAVIYLVAPIAALAVRVPWAEIGAVFSDPETGTLLRLSLAAAALSTVITLLLGVPLALGLQRLRRGGAIVRLLVLLPLAMPPVVSGLALTALLGRRGILAPLLDALGISFAFQFSGVVAAHVFITLPFVVVTVDSALRQLDAEILASAHSVGISRWQMLTRIIVPAITPALVTGAGLAFARSLGEFGTTLTFAGSMPGVTRTMPLGIYLAREVSAENAYALSAILIALALVCLGLASLPALFTRRPTTTALSVGPLDTSRLARLTAPENTDGTAIKVGTEVEFAPRALTAIVGPNGAGKTTLARLIAGRIASPGTRIQITQTTPASAPPRVVLLTQRPGLPRTTTVEGTISMVTRDKGRTTALLNAAGLTSLRDVPVPALSGGQAAHVALVRALATRPDVLLLDEPLAAIDVAGAARWRGFLRATANQRTTLLVTHNAADLRGLADDIAVVSGGRVIAHGKAAALLSAPPTDFVAHLAGLNRVEGTIRSVSGEHALVDVPNITTQIATASAIDTPAADEPRPDASQARLEARLPHAGDAYAPRVDLHAGDRAAVVFTPSELDLAGTGEAGISGTVHAVEAGPAALAAGSLLVTLNALGTQVQVLVPWEKTEALHSGDEVSLTLAPGSARVVPPAAE